MTQPDDGVALSFSNSVYQTIVPRFCGEIKFEKTFQKTQIGFPNLLFFQVDKIYIYIYKIKFLPTISTISQNYPSFYHPKTGKHDLRKSGVL